MAQVEKRKDTALKRAVYQRNYRRARDRALARLGRDYPNLYLEYLYEELEADEKNNKKWVDISGRTRSNGGIGR